MAKRIYLNNVSTKLTAQLLAAGTTANVTAGDGALFAGAAAGDWIIATLRRMSGFKDVAREIVKITARSTDALTITRAQESTTALQFEVGDRLDVDFTAATISDLEAAWTAYTPTIAAGTGAYTTTSATGAYRQVGKTVQFRATVTITSVGTAGSFMQVSLPVTAVGTNWAATGTEQTTGFVTNCLFASASALAIRKYDNTFLGANGYIFNISGTYEST